MAKKDLFLLKKVKVNTAGFIANGMTNVLFIWTEKERNIVKNARKDLPAPKRLSVWQRRCGIEIKNRLQEQTKSL